MPQKPPITPYRGRLSSREVAEGMNAAARNAKRLLSDAIILMDAKRFPSAASLAILSIEESGKLPLLRGLAACDDNRIDAGWQDYRRHRAKNVAWIIADLARRGAKTLADLAPIYDRSSDHPAVLNVVKQLGFYTDCYGDKHWSKPCEVIDEPLAAILISVAEILCPKHETTEQEIALWREYVGPHWGTPMMMNDVLEFHRALEREGLARHSFDEMVQFMLGPQGLSDAEGETD